VVGEDLGTVPPGVRPAIRRYGLHGMHVACFQMSPEPGQALKPIKSNRLASINTHDMVPFSAFWQGLEVRNRVELDLQTQMEGELVLAVRENLKSALLDFLQNQALLDFRTSDLRDILHALLIWLGRCKAPMMLVNLEPLERDSAANILGTSQECPNWRNNEVQFRGIQQNGTSSGDAAAIG
jgi:4-alpha-glucanotransferase